MTEQVFTKDILKNILMGDFNFHDKESNYASHNFHSFPAKFPPQLPQKLIYELSEEGDVILDPMVGSGTTVVEAILLNRKAIGFDIDPLALEISKVKITPLEEKVVEDLLEIIIYKASSRVNKSPDNLRSQIEKTFDKETLDFLDCWYLPSIQGELFALSQEINSIENEDFRRFFKVAFSGTIVTKSGGVSLALDLGHTRPHLAKKVIDKQGKTIIGNPQEKYPSYATKIFKSAILEFEKKARANLIGVSNIPQNCYIPEIRYGNAQNLDIEENSIDLIITSPPYASNAIDYMRAHKFSLIWFGDGIKSLSEKRKAYIGSESTNGFDFEELPFYTKSIIKKIKQVDTKKSLVLHRYYSEMTRVLKEMYRVLRPGKISVVVVGNSMLRGIDTEIPYCLSEIGQEVGFSVPVIGVRELDRNRRMLPTSNNVNLTSQIQQRMHEEHLIGFLKG
ncbi:MAG: site-specific DNA-methyltransferase [Leptolinea sp.]|jgi:DNA modification methylase|nr:site-specific DNA-methyltransferase [Leptolinea sp.]